MIASVASLFAALETPSSVSGELAARRLPGFRAHRIAKDASGRPCFLIASRRNALEQQASIVLQNIMVQHDVLCRIREAPSKTHEGRYIVVSFIGKDPALIDFFLSTVETTIAGLGESCSAVQVAQAVERLVVLFSALSRPPRKTVQGLWAELFIIANATNPARLLRAWHATPEDRYDFNAGGERLEVKSALGRNRRHHFSLEQLQPPKRTTLIIASVLVERAGGGTTLEMLLRNVREEAKGDPVLLERINLVAAETLGAGLADSLDDAFDAEFARESLRFYRGEDVPRVPTPIPAGVSDVRFLADLEACLPLTIEEIGRKKGLISSAVSRRKS